MKHNSSLQNSLLHLLKDAWTNVLVFGYMSIWSNKGISFSFSLFKETIYEFPTFYLFIFVPSKSLCFYCYLLWFVKGKGTIMFQTKSATNWMLVLNAISNCKSITCIWNCNIQLHEHWPQLNWLDIWPDLWHIVSELAKCKLGKRR